MPLGAASQPFPLLEVFCNMSFMTSFQGGEQKGCLMNRNHPARMNPTSATQWQKGRQVNPVHHLKGHSFTQDGKEVSHTCPLHSPGTLVDSNRSQNTAAKCRFFENTSFDGA